MTKGRREPPSLARTTGTHLALHLPVGRRAVLATAGTVAASTLMACSGRIRREVSGGSPRALGARLQVRPRPPTSGDAPTGLQPLGLGSGRDGFVFVPSGYRPDDPLPLVMTLHGAGGDGRAGLNPFLEVAEATRFILLAPDSRGRTWDVLLGRYGPDVAYIDRALDETFGRYTVDARQMAVEGFSDGASYALGLGLSNGDLFGRVIAFSPGYAPPAPAEGRPGVFISHGTGDTVLPIDRCSRRIVPALRDRGYDVAYREFDGGHEIPPQIRDEAFSWVGGER
jgi:phospholipase/carboxylesterase